MKSEVIDLIKEILLEILPELEGEDISIDDKLVDLGANSIDRGELITLALERLDLEVPRIEFVKAQTINELANLIAQKKQKL